MIVACIVRKLSPSNVFDFELISVASILLINPRIVVKRNNYNSVLWENQQYISMHHVVPPLGASNLLDMPTVSWLFWVLHNESFCRVLHVVTGFFSSNLFSFHVSSDGVDGRWGDLISPVFLLWFSASGSTFTTIYLVLMCSGFGCYFRTPSSQKRRTIDEEWLSSQMSNVLM